MTTNTETLKTLQAMEARCADGGRVSDKVNGQNVEVRRVWTRVNPPSGVVHETYRTAWYYEGKRMSWNRLVGFVCEDLSN
jgi:hypothetical protein